MNTEFTLIKSLHFFDYKKIQQYYQSARGDCVLYADSGTAVAQTIPAAVTANAVDFAFCAGPRKCGKEIVALFICPFSLSVSRGRGYHSERWTHPE